MKSNFMMIDVGNKVVSKRTALAMGEIKVGKAAFQLIVQHQLPKGDVLKLAEIAGIMGAKKTADLIPLCHPLGLDHVNLKIENHESQDGFTVYCTAVTSARTGVEMEALCGVNAALLTIYDLTKMVEPNLCINHVRLLAKIGGKSGIWLNPDGVPEWVLPTIAPMEANLLQGVKCGVLTLSDRASQGEYDDRSGKVLKEILTKQGAEIGFYDIVPDDQEIITDTIRTACKTHQLNILVTTGGTGVAPRDVTPEAMETLTKRTIPGIGELLRISGAQFTPNTWSSRSMGAVYENTLLIALPGSPKAVQQGLDVLLPLFPHFLLTLNGGKHDQL